MVVTDRGFFCRLMKKNTALRRTAQFFESAGAAILQPAPSLNWGVGSAEGLARKQRISRRCRPGSRRDGPLRWTVANETAHKGKRLSGACRRESLRFDSFYFYFLYLSPYQSSKRTSRP